VTKEELINLKPGTIVSRVDDKQHLYHLYKIIDINEVEIEIQRLSTGDIITRELNRAYAPPLLQWYASLKMHYDWYNIKNFIKQ